MDINAIKKKDNPSEEELKTFCKFYLDNDGEEALMKEIPDTWDEDEIKSVIRELKLSKRPSASRNYASLGRPPLEDPFSR